MSLALVQSRALLGLEAAAVTVEVAPMVNCPGPGVAEAVACRVSVSFDPSGKESL